MSAFFTGSDPSFTPFIIDGRRIHGPLLAIAYHISSPSLAGMMNAYYVMLPVAVDLSSRDNVIAFRWVWLNICGVDTSIAPLSTQQRVTAWSYLKQFGVPELSPITERWFAAPLRDINVNPTLIRPIVTNHETMIYNIPPYSSSGSYLSTTEFDNSCPSIDRDNTPPSLTSFVSGLSGDVIITSGVWIISHPLLPHRIAIKGTAASTRAVSRVMMSPESQEAFTCLPRSVDREGTIYQINSGRSDIHGSDDIVLIIASTWLIPGVKYDTKYRYYVVSNKLGLPLGTEVMVMPYGAKMGYYNLCVDYDLLKLRYRTYYLGPIVKALGGTDETAVLSDDVLTFSTALASNPVRITVGRNRLLVPCYPTVVMMRSPFIHNAVNGKADVVSSLEFMPETDISAVDTWAFSFVWTYLNGLDDGRIEKLNQAAFKVWDYISYFGIPLDSRFVVRYLLRLFYLVPMDSINSDVMVYCQQLYERLIPYMDRVLFR